MKYYVYILQCSDDSLYTGITNDVKHRFEQHKLGKGSKYVRSRLPFRHIHTEEFPDKREAMQREFEVKSWSRSQKIERLGLKLED